MPESNPITRSDMPHGAHQSYAKARNGQVPRDFVVNSVTWDDLPLEDDEPGRSWIEWLFDIRPPVTTGEFDEYKESSRVFGTSLIRGINWEKAMR